MPENVAQETVDFVCQILDLGHWIRLKNPTDADVLHRLRTHAMSPLQNRWRFHPDNYNLAWQACPGRAIYEVITARQLAHPTNPEENWRSEPVWLLRLKKQKRPTAWWIGFFDPSQVCLLFFKPETRCQTMADLLERLVDSGVRLCTPVPAPYRAAGDAAVQKAMLYAERTRRTRQNCVPSVRPAKWVFNNLDWNSFQENLSETLRDDSLARSCALMGGWVNRNVIAHIDMAVITEGPTAASKRGPVGKVFHSSDGLELVDDGAEREQIAHVIGTYATEQPGIDFHQWPRKSFMPPPSTTTNVFILPSWTAADDRRLARAVSRPPEPLQQPRSRREWEAHFKENIDRGRMKYVTATRRVCHLFLDKVIGPVPDE